MRRALCLCVVLLLAPVVPGGPAGAAEECTGSSSVEIGVVAGRHVVEHCVEVSPGVSLFVVEKYRDAALDRSPRKAVLLMPPTLVTSTIWNSDVITGEGFNGIDRVADANVLAYSVDYWGYGRSSKPANGLDVTRERMLEHAGALVEWIRGNSGAPVVDIIGLSLGSLVAFAVGGTLSPIPPDHVGKVVLGDVLYREASPVLKATLLGPVGCALLAGSPDGYMETNAAIYAPLNYNSEPPGLLWCMQNCPGRYAAGPTYTGCNLPVYDAATGRAPALVLFGDRDVVDLQSDVEQFVAEYGGPVEFEIVAGGAHTMHWEAIRDYYWSRALGFLGA